MCGDKQRNMNTGKSLERFVAATQEMAADKSVSVEVNKKEFFDSGVQRAEYDIILEDSSSSPPERTLIECRDRPSKGAAEGAWIQQMIGKKLADGFDKAVAVSTTGFSESAVYYAAKGDIDLLDVKQLEIPENWQSSSYPQIEQGGVYSGFACINVPEEYRDKIAGFVEYLNEVKGDALLCFEQSGDKLTARNFFQKVCRINHHVTYDSLMPGQEKKATVSYDEASGGLGRCFIQFHDNLIGITRFTMAGVISLRESTQVFAGIYALFRHDGGEIVSQKVELPKIEWANKNIELWQIYKPDGSGELKLRLEPKSFK